MEFDVQMRLLLPMRHVTSLHFTSDFIFCHITTLFVYTVLYSAQRCAYVLETVAQAKIARSAALRVCLGLTLRQAARTRLQGGAGR